MAENSDNSITVKENKKFLSLPQIQVILIIGTFLILIFNYFLLSYVADGTKDTASLLLAGEESIKSILDSTDTAKPAISLIHIVDSSCSDCFSLVELLEQIKLFNLNIVEEKEINYDSVEGEELIEKYSIEKIPSIIIFGETDKIGGLIESWESIGSIEEDNALVLRDVPPVYLDLAIEQHMGRVELIQLVDSNCGKCSQTLSSNEFNQIGITISEEKIVEINSPKGRELVERYSIERIPTVLLSEEIEVYGAIIPSLEDIGTFEEDGTYIVREVSPLYLDINSGELIGETKITYLTGLECSECYDVNIHREILMQNFGLVISEEEYIDVNSTRGREILRDYNILKVPTVIISGDVDAYIALKSMWLQVGTIEEDGSYIFRELDALGDIKYTNLSYEDIVMGAES